MLYNKSADLLATYGAIKICFDCLIEVGLVHNVWLWLCLFLQVVVLQEYHNDSGAAIEAKYVFPLDEMSVVCGFEAFINGKHVVGVVKEKETAHREYRQAVEAGHGAYLMDQEKEQPVELLFPVFCRHHVMLCYVIVIVRPLLQS